MSVELIAEARALQRYQPQQAYLEMIKRLADALEAEIDSHIETAEIMRRVQYAREAVQEVAANRQRLIDQLRAEKGAAVADADYWKRQAEK